MTYLRTGVSPSVFCYNAETLHRFSAGVIIAAGENSSINVHGYSEVVGES